MPKVGKRRQAMSAEDYMSETVHFCNRCGMILHQKEDGEQVCYRCTPIVNEFKEKKPCPKKW
jgi:hypothetical protein